MTLGDAIAFSSIPVCMTILFVVKNWRRWFCAHEWAEVGKEIDYYSAADEGRQGALPIYRKSQFRCTKCGDDRTYKR